MKRVLALAFVIALCLGLSACSGPSPTDVTNTYLQAIKDNDEEAQLDTYVGVKDAEVFDFKHVFEGESEDPFLNKIYVSLGKQLPAKPS